MTSCTNDCSRTGAKVASPSSETSSAPPAIDFGPPLGLDPADSMQEFAARLQVVCYRLTRQVEKALIA